MDIINSSFCNSVELSDSPIEITRDNWIIGKYWDNYKSVLYELHYCTSNYYKGGFLIDDVWIQDKYDFDIKKKIDIYLLESECMISHDFVLDDRYCFFLKCKKIEKKFIYITEIDPFFSKVISDKYKNLESIYCVVPKKPVLTIVTTVFNNAFLLEQTLQSVINQDSNEFEYVIKDADSKDCFDDVIAKYYDYGIRVIKARDKGIYDGMDQGFKAANGEYVQVLNSDDVFYSNNVITKYVSYINKNDADAYCSDIMICYPSNKSFIRKADLSKLRYRSCINHTSLALKRSDYLKLGGFDLNLSIAADCDLTIKMQKSGLIIKHLDLLCVRFRAEGASNSAYTLKMLKENLICRYRYSTFNIMGYCFTLLQFLKIKIYKIK